MNREKMQRDQIYPKQATLDTLDVQTVILNDSDVSSSLSNATETAQFDAAVATKVRRDVAAPGSSMSGALLPDANSTRTATVTRLVADTLSLAGSDLGSSISTKATVSDLALYADPNADNSFGGTLTATTLLPDQNATRTLTATSLSAPAIVLDGVDLQARIDNAGGGANAVNVAKIGGAMTGDLLPNTNARALTGPLTTSSLRVHGGDAAQHLGQHVIYKSGFDLSALTVSGSASEVPGERWSRWALGGTSFITVTQADHNGPNGEWTVAIYIKQDDTLAQGVVLNIGSWLLTAGIDGIQWTNGMPTGQAQTIQNGEYLVSVDSNMTLATYKTSTTEVTLTPIKVSTLMLSKPERNSTEYMDIEYVEAFTLSGAPIVLSNPRQGSTYNDSPAYTADKALVNDTTRAHSAKRDSRRKWWMADFFNDPTDPIRTVTSRALSFDAPTYASRNAEEVYVNDRYMGVNTSNASINRSWTLTTDYSIDTVSFELSDRDSNRRLDCMWMRAFRQNGQEIPLSNARMSSTFEDRGAFNALTRGTGNWDGVGRAVSELYADWHWLRAEFINDDNNPIVEVRYTNAVAGTNPDVIKINGVDARNGPRGSLGFDGGHVRTFAVVYEPFTAVRPETTSIDNTVTVDTIEPGPVTPIGSLGGFFVGNNSATYQGQLGPVYAYDRVIDLRHMAYGPMLRTFTAARYASNFEPMTADQTNPAPETRRAIRRRVGPGTHLVIARALQPKTTTTRTLRLYQDAQYQYFVIVEVKLLTRSGLEVPMYNGSANNIEHGTVDTPIDGSFPTTGNNDIFMSGDSGSGVPEYVNTNWWQAQYDDYDYDPVTHVLFFSGGENSDPPNPNATWSHSVPSAIHIDGVPNAAQSGPSLLQSRDPFWNLGHLMWCKRYTLANVFDPSAELRVNDVAVQTASARAGQAILLQQQVTGPATLELFGPEITNREITAIRLS